MDELNIGLKIKARREELGLSQKDLAVVLNLHPNKISMIEKGKKRVHPTKHMPVLTKILKVPINWFFEDIEVAQNATPLEGLLIQYFPAREFTKEERELVRRLLDACLPIFVEAMNLKKPSQSPSTQESKKVTTSKSEKIKHAKKSKRYVENY